MLFQHLNGKLAGLLCAGVVTLGLLALPVSEANAVTTEAPSRADLIAKLQASPAQIFLDADGKSLTVGALISTVRDFVVSDKNALRPIIEALKLASTEEKSAIGTGLGQAAQALLKTDAALAAEVQEVLAASGDSAAILAFSAVTGNVPIGSTAGGGAAGAGGAGSSVGGGQAGGGGGTGGGGGGGGTTSSVLFSSGVTTPNTTTTTTTTTTVFNATTSVSP